MCRVFNRMTPPRLRSRPRALATLARAPASSSKAAGNIKKILSSFDRIAMMRLHWSGHRFVVSMLTGTAKDRYGAARQPRDDEIP
jgi:hypothetical protein